MRVRAAAILMLAILGAAAALAAGSSRRPGPLVVTQASLTQTGPDLVWSLTTATPFTPDELARDGRALCLLLERATVFGEICVRHPGSDARPSLYWRPVTRQGPTGGHPLQATVTRATTDQLTASFTPASFGAGYESLRWQVFSDVFGRRRCAAERLRVGCGVAYPAMAAAVQLRNPDPTGCEPAGPAYVTGSTLPGPGKVVALTFDDGPWYQTPEFLDVLEREHAVATFFQIGRQLSSFGAAVDRRMLADGDVIGDHTWDHINVAGAGAAAQTQIVRTANAIQALTGFRPCLFRAPYGATSPALIAQARRLGFTTIQWNVDPGDWRRPGTAVIEERVISAVRPGSIVIQHDGGGDRSQTLAALPHEINTLRADGYSFVTVPQLLGLHFTY
jgi:peptidoglycan/xylan/chitin deacetylase (PgdA/CDA1 family)